MGVNIFDGGMSMWTRYELKERARQSLKANYWRVFLAGLFMVFLTEGNFGIGNGPGAGRSSALYGSTVTERIADVRDSVDTIRKEHIKAEAFDFSSLKEVFAGQFIDRDDAESMILGELDTKANIVVLTVMAFVAVIIIIGILFGIFIFNPLMVGGCKFFKKNLGNKAELDNLTSSFGSNYMNIVTTMFYKGLFEFLWFLLLIVPGIVKAYEYRMIPYILGDNPDMDWHDAFEKSKKMMMNNKWDAFVLDLSFIGWYLLRWVTFGIAGIFYVNPYVYQTDAALYEKLLDNDNIYEVYENYVEME